jgi:hypothetical protein
MKTIDLTDIELKEGLNKITHEIQLKRLTVVFTCLIFCNIKHLNGDGIDNEKEYDVNSSVERLWIDYIFDKNGDEVKLRGYKHLINNIKNSIEI